MPGKLDIYRSLVVNASLFRTTGYLQELDSCIGKADLIIDSIFGTGLSRDIGYCIRCHRKGTDRLYP